MGRGAGKWDGGRRDVRLGIYLLGMEGVGGVSGKSAAEKFF